MPDTTQTLLAQFAKNVVVGIVCSAFSQNLSIIARIMIGERRKAPNKKVSKGKKG